MLGGWHLVNAIPFSQGEQREKPGKVPIQRQALEDLPAEHPHTARDVVEFSARQPAEQQMKGTVSESVAQAQPSTAKAASAVTR